MCVCGVVWHVHNATRLYIQNVPVCTGTTRVLDTSGRFADTHGDVLNVHTGGVLNVPHTAHTPTQRHTETDRESEKEDRERGERRDDERREEGGREREKKEKKKRSHVHQSGMYMSVSLLWLILP